MIKTNNFIKNLKIKKNKINYYQFCSISTNTTTNTNDNENIVGPLDGVSVVEVGSFVAGPYCGTILGYFGADIIKVEPLTGDQVRQFRDVDENGTSW